MPVLAKAAQPYFTNYVRGGSKESRKKEVARIIEFLEWVEIHKKIRSLQSLGNNQVKDFWNANDQMADSTAYRYWLAIAKLWAWLDKHGHPPKKIPNDQLTKPKTKKEKSYFNDPGQAIKAARQLRQISLQNLANLTGVEVTEIEAIEKGDAQSNANHLPILLKALGIVFYISSKKIESLEKLG